MDSPSGLEDPTPADAGRTGGRVVCPHCWHTFRVEKILAVAQHPELLGDDVLGDGEYQRFLPSRFTPQGHAIDALGVVCPDLACPRCHLVVPGNITEKRPFFFSIIGAQSSGKSYWLTSMVWDQRRLMPRKFGFTFNDADTTSNAIINEYERTLFLCADKDAPTSLAKTEMTGEMYDRVKLNNMEQRLPRPLMFSLRPQPHHPLLAKMGDNLNRTIVLYDNAGEHFLPGADSAATPGTQHLARSNGIFFLFDPSMDPRFRSLCKSKDPQMRKGARVERQEILLTEAISRIKRHAHQPGTRKGNRPVIIVVTKYDIWRSLLKHDLPEPWRTSRASATTVLDSDAIGIVSFAVRRLLAQICPEVVATAESFSSRVTYLPVSALGHSPFEPKERVAGEQQGDPGPVKRGSVSLVVRPKNIKSIWPSVPMLCMLAHFGMIPQIRRKRTGPDQLPVAQDCVVSGRMLVVTVPGTDQRLEMPGAYAGRAMRCPVTGTWFWVPSIEEALGEAPANAE